MASNHRLSSRSISLFIQPSRFPCELTAARVHRDIPVILVRTLHPSFLLVWKVKILCSWVAYRIYLPLRVQTVSRQHSLDANDEMEAIPLKNMHKLLNTFIIINIS
jgi:hypothetical protein